MAGFALDNTEIVRAVLQMTGLGRTPATALADAAVEADVRAIIRSGLRRFYFPVLPTGGTYQWRFLEENFQVSAEAVFDDGTIEVSGGTVTLTGGTWPTDVIDHYIDVDNHVLFVTSRDSDTQVTVSHTQLSVDSGTSYEAPRYRYALPSDFGEFLGGVMYQDATENWELLNSDEPSLRLRYAQGYELDDDTTHYAIRDSKIMFWPTPTPDAFIQGVYLKIPDDDLPADLDTPGSTVQVTPIYAEAVLEAIMAAAEAYNDDTAGIHEAKFQTALQAAINHDSVVGGHYNFSRPSIPEIRGRGRVNNIDFTDAVI